MDFTTIHCRLYNLFYDSPPQFWEDLGLVFKNVRRYRTNKNASIRKITETMRELAYHLYKDWFANFSKRLEQGAKQAEEGKNEPIEEEPAQEEIPASAVVQEPEATQSPPTTERSVQSQRQPAGAQ